MILTAIGSAPAFKRRALTKTLLVMKLTTILILAGLLKVSAGGFGQTLSMNLKNASLKQAFQEVEKQSGYSFVYGKEQLSGAGKVSLTVKDVEIDVVLGLIFKDQSLTYTITDKYIVLKQKTGSAGTINRAETTPSAIEISGRVLNDKGDPVAGATVTIRGTKIATQTNQDGSFRINAVKNNDVLVITYVGFEKTEIRLSGQPNIGDISLAQTPSSLEQVVVTGYTAERKRNITGSVSSVAGKDLVTNTSNNIAQKLQGRVSGVTVTNSPGPGGSVMVRIRGVGSVTGVNDPLYVIDGVPTRGGLTDLNPNDVEDIQVLKDASAASVYGARANNGVIVITTKKGKSGAVKVAFNTFAGVQKSYNFYDQVTPLQYAQLRWDDAVNQGKDPRSTPYGAIGNGSGPALPDYIIPFVMAGNPLVDSSNYSRNVDGPGWLVNKFMITKANQAGTDWFKECTRPAAIQSYDMSVSGGFEKGRYLVSGGLYNQDGILKYTYLTRYSLRVNSDFNLSKAIRFGENVQLGYTKSNGVSLYEDYGLMGKIYSALRLQPIYDIAGNFSGNRAQTDPGIAYNPYAQLYRNKDNKFQTVRVLGNLFAEADLLKGLTYRANFGFDYGNSYGSGFSPLALEDRLATQVASLTVNNSYNINLTLTNLLTYRLNVANRHDIKLLTGTEVIRGSYRNSSITKNGYAFEDPSFQFLNSGSNVGTANGGGVESRLLSYFGKLDYAFDKKYLLSATVRRDASSNFAPAKRWGTFPAFGVGWLASEEDFMKSSGFISTLKLRGSWGITGNQDIDPNNQYYTYSSNPIVSYYDIGGTNTSIVQGFQADRIGNPQAQWEEQVMTNIGLDIGLVKDKLFFSADVYNRETRKLLLVVPVASSGGTNVQPATNVGSMENKGIDLSLNYNATVGNDMKIQVGAIWSTYKNKVTELYNGSDGFIQFDNQRTSTLSRTQQGYPIGQFWGYINDGIFQDAAKAGAYPTQNGDRSLYNQPGRFIFRNVNGDTVVNTLDRTFIGSPHPKFTYGLNVNLQYKSFDLALFIQGSYGNKIFNFLKVITDFFPFNTSPSVRMLDSWTPTNPNAILPKTNSSAAGFESNANSYYIEDGSYLRGKTLSIGYTMPAKLLSKVKATNARFYIQGTNLFTITKYTGIDPEVPVQNPGAGADLQYGLDKGTYPFTRTFTIGLQLGF